MSKAIMSEDTQTTDLFFNSTASGRDSPPQIPIDSPGSSVSSRLKEEYSQLLKYTIESTPGLNTILPLLQGTDNEQTGNGAETERDSNDNNMNMNSCNQDPDSGFVSLATGTRDLLSLNGTTIANFTNAIIQKLASEEARGPCVRTMNMSNTSVANMGIKLDDLLGTLKDNILEELSYSLRNCLRSQHEDHLKSSENVQADKASLQKEVNQLTEQMNNLEHSSKQKCTLIKNLTDSLVAQKKKVEMAKHFYHWKADHYDKQREIFTEKLAVQHHERKLNLRVLKAWYGVIQTRWRSRTERKSQTQAKEMCMSLSSDYEVKVGMLNEKICALEKKVSLLQAEREMYSEQVKKAFMRGMCALNMETMSVFGDDQQKQSQDTDESTLDIQEVSTLDTNTLITSLEEMESQPKSFNNMIEKSSSQSPTSRSPTRPGGSKQQVQSRQQGSILQHSTQPQQTPMVCCSNAPKAKATKSKPKSNKCQGNNNKIVSPSQVLAPPMASVVVERHPPVNKVACHQQTMGKATAVRYPKKNCETVPIQFSTVCPNNRGVGEMRFKPLAGQKDSRNDNRIVSDSYIKVVE